MYRVIFCITLLCSLAVAQNNRTARILGGNSAGLGEVPYQVSLRTWGSNFHFCGGSLISNRWIVTAATCVHNRAHNSLAVVAGINSLWMQGVQRRSSTIRIHPNYSPPVVDFNIGLVQTSMVFPLNSLIFPIRLGSSIIRDEAPARVSGFGAMEVNAGANSDRLQVLQVTIATNEECDGEESWVAGADFVTNLCTRVNPGEGFCTSDLGGPLVSNSFLVGIVNWNIPCGFGVHELYVRISHFRLWIASITGV